jgi:hypothetical protein
MDGCLLALSIVVVPRAGLMAYVGHRAFGMLHSRLLDEGLRLMAQVACLGRREFGHGLEQHRCCDELLACSRWCVRIVDIEVSVDALAGLLA